MDQSHTPSESRLQRRIQRVGAQWREHHLHLELLQAGKEVVQLDEAVRGRGQTQEDEELERANHRVCMGVPQTWVCGSLSEAKSASLPFMTRALILGLSGSGV